MILRGRRETTHNQKKQLNRKEYINALRSIHRQTLHTQSNKDRKQLGTPPPKIAEKTLPRIARIRLAQQNWMPPLLNSYLSQIWDYIVMLVPNVK